MGFLSGFSKVGFVENYGLKYHTVHVQEVAKFPLTLQKGIFRSHFFADQTD